MSTYAIGDLHGCHAEFVSLLEKLSFNAANDTLWLVGDLVNRGPGSLACLQEVQALGSAARCVLGNHDFHLLVVARGGGKLKKTIPSAIFLRHHSANRCWIGCKASHWQFMKTIR